MFFDGNALNAVGNYEPEYPPSLATNSTECSAFSTTVDGVLTPLENATHAHGVSITEIVPGGFSLAHDATAAEVTNSLVVLPSVESPMLTYRGVANEQEGNTWTMSFSSNEGAVEEIFCVTEPGFSGYCKVMREFMHGTPFLDYYSVCD